VEVQGDGEEIRLTAAKILIACCTRPAHSPEIPFDNHRIVDADHLAELGGLPREVLVVGAGVVGLEYASFMAELGADVTLIDQRPVILEFVDRQIVEALSYHLRQLGVTFRLAEKVTRNSTKSTPLRRPIIGVQRGPVAARSTASSAGAARSALRIETLPPTAASLSQ
jgi:NAD(P) transhydrogenase